MSDKHAACHVALQKMCHATSCQHLVLPHQRSVWQEGPRADSNPWGDLQPGGQVDWSIRPKAASLVAANKAGSRSASPAPSAVSIRSLPNLAPPQSKLPTKSASQEGLGSPRGDPLAGMSSAEIQAHMAQQAEGAASAEAGSLSDNTFGGSGSRGSPVGSLADSATGLPGAGDKGAGQAALEPSIQEADKVGGRAGRCWVLEGESSVADVEERDQWLQLAWHMWTWRLREHWMLPVLRACLQPELGHGQGRCWQWVRPAVSCSTWSRVSMLTAAVLQLQGALSRWCSSAHSSEDEAVILASDYIPADIKEAVCSSSPQVCLTTSLVVSTVVIVR